MFEQLLIIPFWYVAPFLFLAGAAFVAISSRRKIELKAGGLTLKIEGSSSPPSLLPAD